MNEYCTEGEVLLATGMPAVSILLCEMVLGSGSAPVVEMAIFLGVHYVAILYPGSLLSRGLVAAAVAVFSYAVLRLGRSSGRKGAAEEKDPKSQARRLLVWKREQQQLLDQFRASVILMVNICTFACDFNHFPLRFLKTKRYGLSLMDVGVVSFLMNAGILAGRGKPSLRFERLFPLLALGMLRLFIIRGCGYSTDPTEYGTCLNFYFVFAAVEVICTLLRWMPSFIAGILLCVAYEAVLLKTGLPEAIFSADRSTFVMANKEGLVATVPYAVIHFLSRAVGKRIFAPVPHKVRLRYLATYTLFFFSAYYCAALVHPPSRRLGNAAFVFFMMALNMLHVTILQVLIGLRLQTKMQTLRFVGRRMGKLFLLSNALILAGNMATNWRRLGEAQSNAVNALYLFLVFVAPYLVEAGADTYRQRNAEVLRAQGMGGATSK